jgi:hypothetical protein
MIPLYHLADEYCPIKFARVWTGVTLIGHEYYDFYSEKLSTKYMISYLAKTAKVDLRGSGQNKSTSIMCLWHICWGVCWVRVPEFVGSSE